MNDYIVVSQKFHCERAIHIASKKGQNVIGFCAQDVTSLLGMKVKIREVFARVKAMIDIYLLNKSPRFLGKKEKVILQKAAQ